ncbi:MAG: alternative ribosome rescue aminoacyl-tRNA hydrolase ArfB [Planctomycetota bacterium]
MLRVNQHISITRSEVKVTDARSPGPGVQNFNKLNTKAILRWHLESSPSVPNAVKARFRSRFPTRINAAGEVMITSHEHREQASNAAACLERLRDLLLKVAQPPKQRKETRPTAGSQRRRLENKKKVSEKKQMRSRRSDD